ncbi:MBL fold metallo-hydrolase [Thioclava sp. FR2]|uniref:MBL fold metallo-hydrolase n=1 Tax=Thioclava sp. FR2 TaxID=3445780 RepID=UPI003EC0789A
MTDQITLLGVKGGPALRQGGAMPTASLLEFAGRRILIDCGIGAARSTVYSGVSLLNIDAIFITHLHSDHILELGPLLYTAWTTGLNRPVRVFGPPGIGAYWENFLKAMRFDHDIRLVDEGRPDIAILVEVTEFGEGPIVDLDGIEVKAMRVDHPPVTDCFALSFAAGTKRVVFSADTCYFPPLADFARGATVLVHEAMLVAGVDKLVARTPGAGRLREHLLASHTTAQDAGRIAAAGMVGQLVLNHLVPADDPDFTEADWRREVSRHWNGHVVVGHDGLVVPIE